MVSARTSAKERVTRINKLYVYVTTVTFWVLSLEDKENEIIIFTDNGSKQDIIKQFDASKVKINKSSFGFGLPLRISSSESSRIVFETALKLWMQNKDKMTVTFRIAQGKTIELNDSSLPEIEKLISQLR